MHDLPSQGKSEGSLGHGQTGEDNFGEGLVRLSVNRVIVSQPVSVALRFPFVLKMTAGTSQVYTKLSEVKKVLISYKAGEIHIEIHFLIPMCKIIWVPI